VVLGHRGGVEEAAIVDVSQMSVGRLQNRRKALREEIARLEKQRASLLQQQQAPKNATDTDDDGPQMASPEEVTRMREQGKLYTVVACFVLLAVIAFEMIHLKFSDVDWNRNVPLLDAEDPPTNLEEINFDGVCALATPFFLGEAKEKAATLLIAILVLRCGVLLWASYVVNDISGRYWDAIQAKQWEMFLACFLAFCALIVVQIFAVAYVQYLTGMLTIEWRQWLTRRLQASWFKNQAFYRMQLASQGGDPNMGVDNPDQRIEADAARFCDLWLGLFTGVLSAMGQGVVFMVLVYTLSPVHPFGYQGIKFQGWLLLTSVVYVAICTWLTHIIGHKLILIGYAQQRFQADFRSGLIRVRDQSEAIALYRSEERENERLVSRFEDVKRGFWESMFYNKKLTMSNYFFTVVSELFPIIVLGPAFFQGVVTLGVFFRLRNALGQMNDSLTWGVNAYSEIADFRAVTNRLMEFQRMAKLAQDRAGPGPHLSEKAAAIAFSGVEIQYPDSKPLLRDVNLVMPKGRWVLLSGAEGSGKTTLQRAAAGIWPYVNGDVTLPVESTTFLPPTSKHSLRSGTLREAVSYPCSPGAFPDAEIEEAISAVGLDRLLERLPGEKSALDREEDWTMRLSAGERQRMDVAHVLLAKPEWLFCDELTSHMSAKGAGKVYEMLRQRLPTSTVVSVAHNVDQLRRFHDAHWMVDPENKRIVVDESAPEFASH